ncbi:hypothetical protein CP556_16865 [Natrinema sp. CBA1119]|nr:hypothetical protein CP556_16865 [Natrinema sp. CBA1119]
MAIDCSPTIAIGRCRSVIRSRWTELAGDPISAGFRRGNRFLRPLPVGLECVSVVRTRTAAEWAFDRRATRVSVHQSDRVVER